MPVCFLQDQLGNVRVSLEDNGSGVAKLTQENHYYPLGLTMQGIVNNTPIPSVANKQLYNAGSELQDDWGFEHSYSTFYREYDPALGRFNALDPMADQFSSCTPYNFAFNDPVNQNDPQGDYPTYSHWGYAGDSQRKNARENDGGGNSNFGGFGSMSAALAAASEGRAAQGHYTSEGKYYTLSQTEAIEIITDHYFKVNDGALQYNYTDSRGH